MQCVLMFYICVLDIMLRIKTAVRHVLGARTVASRTASSGPAFSLPALPYALDALEPYMSKETLEFHHGKHHKTYVDNLNKFAEKDPSLRKHDLHALIELAPAGPVFNNVAQIWNHTFFWNSLTPNSGGKPVGKLLSLIERDFGSFEAFKEKFTAVATGHFASGWAWLVQTNDSTLKIVDTHDAGNPLRDGLGTPLLTCDMWEHAYYIDHRNARPKYMESFWKLANWNFAASNLH